MPNWCSCDLAVRGKPEQIDAFLAAVAEEKNKTALSFDKVVPKPEELKDTESGSGEMFYQVKYQSDAAIAHIFTYRWVKEADVTKRDALWKLLVKERRKIDPAATDRSCHAMADHYKLCVDKYGHRTWYSWANANWGTKWDASDAQLVSRKPKVARLRFDTAWSPPLPVIATMSERWPALSFKLKYYECGCGFKGVYHVKSGEELENSQSEYHGGRGG